MLLFLDLTFSLRLIKPLDLLICLILVSTLFDILSLSLDVNLFIFSIIGNSLVSPGTCLSNNFKNFLDFNIFKEFCKSFALIFNKNLFTNLALGIFPCSPFNCISKDSINAAGSFALLPDFSSITCNVPKAFLLVCSPNTTILIPSIFKSDLVGILSPDVFNNFLPCEL